MIHSFPTLLASFYSCKTLCCNVKFVHIEILCNLFSFFLFKARFTQNITLSIFCSINEVLFVCNKTAPISSPEDFFGLFLPWQTWDNNICVTACRLFVRALLKTSLPSQNVSYRLSRAVAETTPLFYEEGWCLFMWSAKWSDLLKLLSHWAHLNGLTPVCFLWCLVSSSDRAKRHSQPSQGHR